MADESDCCLFLDYFDDFYGTNERVILPRTNPFEEYNDARFKERFRLSKTTVFRLLSEVSKHVDSFCSTHAADSHVLPPSVDLGHRLRLIGQGRNESPARRMITGQ